MFAFVVLITPDGRIVEINEAPLIAAGLRREDVLGQSFLETAWCQASPEAHDRIRQALGRAMQGKTVRDDFVIGLPGGLSTMDGIFSPLCDAAGRVTHVIASAVDITARKRAEEALQASEHRLRTIVETEPECVKVVSRSGELLEMNRSGLAMLEAGAIAEACARPLIEFIAPTYHGAFIRLHQTVMEGGSGQLQFEVVGLKGTRRWLETHAVPLRDATAHIVGMLGVTRDITEHQKATTALTESEERLRLALDAAHMGTFDWDIPNNRITWSRWHEELWGFAPGEFGGTYEAFSQRVHPDDLPRISAEHDRFVTRREASVLEFRVVWPDGSVHWVESHSELSVDEDGTPRRMRGVVMETTERRATEAALRASEARFRELAENIDEGFWMVDPEGQPLYFSPAFERIWGVSRERLLAAPRTWLDSVHPEDRDSVAAAVSAREATGNSDIEYRVIRSDGTMRWVHDRAFCVRAPSGALIRIAGVAIDITDRKEADARMRRLATRDALTELPNRALAADRLEQALAGAGRGGKLVALLFLDLDRFKAVNDSFGHIAGDGLLVETARRLARCVRAEDTVARQGGDEFLIIVPGLEDADGAIPAAERVLAELAQPFAIDGHAVTVTTSIGIAIFPTDGTDAGTLLKNADAAMYAAKAAGRNTCQFFTTSMNARALERLELETALRQAVARQEFAVHYQPQVDLRTGAVVGVEALLRWRNPRHADVAPARFTALAEETGLIVPIGAWVLERACRDAMAWPNEARVAVNVSVRQLRQADFLAVVQRALEVSGLPADRLELELTESALMDQPEQVAARLAALRAAGVRLSIDDFGIGYSSLVYLKRLPVDTLKIDQGFVHGLPADPADAALVRAIIAMAASLSLRVIAEGVETKAQADFLDLAGCGFAQGYHFGRPVPVEDLVAVL